MEMTQIDGTFKNSSVAVPRDKQTRGKEIKATAKLDSKFQLGTFLLPRYKQMDPDL